MFAADRDRWAAEIRDREAVKRWAIENGKFSVFVWKKNRGQVGTGIYPMVACFVVLDVHVPFTVSVFSPSETEYLEEWDKAIQCDKSCRHAQGCMDDFSEERRDGQYLVKPIVDAALAFRK